MFALLFYLCIVLSSISLYSMEQPPRQVQVQKILRATKKIRQEAISAVTNNHLKRLERLLQTHMFSEKMMGTLLDYAQTGKYMGCFALLLSHGAPVGQEKELQVFDGPSKGKVTPLHLALLEYPAFIKPLIMFGAKPTLALIHDARVNTQIQQNAPLHNDYLLQKGNTARHFLKSQIQGKKMPTAQARARFVHDALMHRATLQEAVTHEDLYGLKVLLMEKSEKQKKKRSDLRCKQR